MFQFQHSYLRQSMSRLVLNVPTICRRTVSDCFIYLLYIIYDADQLRLIWVNRKNSTVRFISCFIPCLDMKVHPEGGQKCSRSRYAISSWMVPPQFGINNNLFVKTLKRPNIFCGLWCWPTTSHLAGIQAGLAWSEICSISLQSNF